MEINGFDIGDQTGFAHHADWAAACRAQGLPIGITVERFIAHFTSNAAVVAYSLKSTLRTVNRVLATIPEPELSKRRELARVIEQVTATGLLDGFKPRPEGSIGRGAILWERDGADGGEDFIFLELPQRGESEFVCSGGYGRFGDQVQIGLCSGATAVEALMNALGSIA